MQFFDVFVCGFNPGRKAVMRNHVDHRQCIVVHLVEDCIIGLYRPTSLEAELDAFRKTAELFVQTGDFLSVDIRDLTVSRGFLGFGCAFVVGVVFVADFKNQLLGQLTILAAQQVIKEAADIVAKHFFFADIARRWQDNRKRFVFSVAVFHQLGKTRAVSVFIAVVETEMFEAVTINQTLCQ